MFSEFITLINKIGGIPKFYIKTDTENMRSVYSNQTIPERKRILSIPFKYLISHKKAIKESLLIAKLHTHLKDIRIQHIILSVYLLEFMNTDSHLFKPYFDILPKDLNNIPLFWGQNELKELAGSPFVTKIHERTKTFEEEYDTICKYLTKKELDKLFVGYRTPTERLDRYKYARALVSSRNFSIKKNDESLNVLVPLADMLNHGVPKKTKWGFEDDSFFVDSTTSIAPNTEITDSYGNKSNYYLLLFYGFTIFSKHSPFTYLDTVDVKLNTLKVTLTVPFSSFILKELLYDVRKITSNNVFGVYIDPVNEKKTLYTINKMLISLLDKYPTTHKEDIKLLESGSLDPFSNKYNSLVIISGEKSVLQTYINEIFIILDALYSDEL